MKPRLHKIKKTWRPKPARFSLKNRAHFRRATCSTITKIAVINASSRRGSYINPAHVLYSLCVRGPPILHRIRCKITRVSPKKSEIIRANPRGTRAKHAAQTKYQRFNVSRTIKSSADASAKILQAMRARFARKFCRKSPKPARLISLKNRAHF